MVRRGLGWALALALLVGGAAACSDDDDGAASTTDEGAATGAESESGGGGDDGGETGNPAVDAYCDAVDEYREAVEAQLADPQDMDAQQRAFDLSDDLAEKLQAVGDATQLDPDVSGQLEDCMIRAAEG